MAAPNIEMQFDIAIVGAGPVGTTLALLLHQKCPELKIALIDSRSEAQRITQRKIQNKNSPRTIALSYGSRLLLERINCWPKSIDPIEHIHISQRGHLGRSIIHHDEVDLPALGYVVSYDALMQKLDETRAQCFDASSENLKHLHSTRMLSATQYAGSVTLQLQSQDQENFLYKNLHSNLLISAEGTASLDKNIFKHRYKQEAVLGLVHCQHTQASWAFERFTNEGPLALLPYQSGYALVWCCSPGRASQLTAMNNENFLHELNEAFGQRLGQFISIEQRSTAPLELRALKNNVDGLTVTIGNAAQTLHPVAGQGLNLGLRDAMSLASFLEKHYTSSGITREVLKQFESLRYIDRRNMMVLTDFLASIFTYDFFPFKVLRSLSLMGIGLNAPIKKLLATCMISGHRT